MCRGFRAVVLLLLAALVACGPVTSPESETARPWAVGAEEWLARVQEAGSEGVPNLEPFLAPNVVLDHRATGGRLVRGVGASLATVEDFPYTYPGLRIHPPPYVSRTGLLLPVSWQGPSLYEVRDALLVLRFSSQGIVHEQTLPSLVTGADMFEGDADWAAALGVVDSFLSRHTVHGVTTSVDDLGPGRGPAVFAVPGTMGEGFRRVVAIVRSEDPAGCPGHVALSLRPGTAAVPGVVGEYRRVDDGRRCLRGDARFEGWWNRMAIPDAVSHVRTGTVTVDGVSVEIWNGTPALESLVAWALWRFRFAGLDPPAVASVTFYPSADRCFGNLAIACGPERDLVVACFGENLACVSRPCPPWSSLSRTVVLHEFAHAWVHRNLTSDVRAAYERFVDLRWDEAQDPWESKAVERAAEVIAQGVRDERPSHPLLPISRARLAAEFTMLTGSPPVPQVP